MYNGQDLDINSQANNLIELAAKSMQRDGFLVPAGVIYRPDGEAMVCGLPFVTTQDKQKCFRSFRVSAKEQGAIAIAFISEAWVSWRDKDADLNPAKSSFDESDREEVIVATVVTPVTSVVLMAPVIRLNEEVNGIGEVRSEGSILDAEFSRGVWENTLH